MNLLGIVNRPTYITWYIKVLVNQMSLVGFIIQRYHLRKSLKSIRMERERGRMWYTQGNSFGHFGFGCVCQRLAHTTPNRFSPQFSIQLGVAVLMENRFRHLLSYPSVNGHAPVGGAQHKNASNTLLDKRGWHKSHINVWMRLNVYYNIISAYQIDEIDSLVLVHFCIRVIVIRLCLCHCSLVCIASAMVIYVMCGTKEKFNLTFWVNDRVMRDRLRRWQLSSSSGAPQSHQSIMYILLEVHLRHLNTISPGNPI